MSPELIALIFVGGAALVVANLYKEQRIENERLQDRLDAAQKALEKLQRAFARFAPMAVVDDIASGAMTVTPEKRQVTVLFADLQGFTAMSDTMDPAVLVSILNGYFRVMSEAISANKGHVSKFIGDGIMALFGAPEPNPWQEQDAVKAALAMRAALVGYNQSLAAEGKPTLRVGVGLHRGVAVAGVIGSEQLVEYTVIGDTVNVASRIESLTRGHGVDILVTAEVKEKLDERFVLEEKPAAMVKGKPQPVVTWAVVGLK
jgi:adenylate cyclase